MITDNIEQEGSTVTYSKMLPYERLLVVLFMSGVKAAFAL